MNKKKVLVFSPHPDDEILGCGGSIAKLADEKHLIHLCYLSFGENGSPRCKPVELRETRRREALAVAKYFSIAVDHVTFFEIPDGEIWEGSLEQMKQVMGLIREIRPSVVYLPHEKETSYDHAQASKLIKRALDMAGSNNYLEGNQKAWWVEAVLAYEIWSPLADYQYAEDISNYIDKKVEALALYESQSAQAGNSSDFIGDKARFLPGYRAAMSIGDYREVFQVVRVGNVR